MFSSKPSRKRARWLWALLLMSTAALAQTTGIIGGGVISAGIPGPYPWTAWDWHALVNGSAPTATELNNSTAAAASGATWVLGGSVAGLTGSTAAHFDILSGPIQLANGGGIYSDPGSLGLAFTPPQGNTDVIFDLPSSATKSSPCFESSTTIAQTVATFDRVDFASLTGISEFLTDQIQANSTNLLYGLESDATGGQLIPGLEAQPVFSTNQNYIFCGYYSKGGTLASAQWNATTGALIVEASTPETVNTAPTTISFGNLSANTGPSSGAMYIGQGITNYGDAAAAFPLLSSPPGIVPLQLFTPIPNNPGGTYGASVNVTLSSDATNISNSFYYTLNGTTPTTSSTLYIGTVNISSSPTTMKSINCATNYACSAVRSDTYTLSSSPYSNGAACGGDGFGETTQACTGGVTVATTSDILLMVGSSSANTATLSVSGCSATWTIETSTIDVNSGMAFAIFAGTSPATGSCTPTLTSTGSGSTSLWGVDMTNTSGIDVVGAGAASGSVTSGGTISAPGVTTTHANDVVIGFFSDQTLTADSFTVGSGYTAYNTQPSNFGVLIEGIPEASTGTYTPTATYPHTGHYGIGSIALHP